MSPECAALVLEDLLDADDIELSGEEVEAIRIAIEILNDSGYY